VRGGMSIPRCHKLPCGSSRPLSMLLGPAPRQLLLNTEVLCAPAGSSSVVLHGSPGLALLAAYGLHVAP